MAGEYKTALNRINERSIVVTIGKQTAKNPLAREVTITLQNLDVVQLPRSRCTTTPS